MPHREEKSAFRADKIFFVLKYRPVMCPALSVRAAWNKAIRGAGHASGTRKRDT